MDIKNILKKLKLEDFAENGKYENHFYVISLADSNEYAKVYTVLEENAINTEYPVFTANTNNTTTKVTNYFETEVDNKSYNLFLIANLDDDIYYLKIGEK